MYDGDEAPAARRSGLRIAALVGGVGVLAASTVVGLVLWNDGRSPEATAPVTVPATTGIADPDRPVENMLERITEGGLEVRLLLTDDANMFGGNIPPAGAPPWCTATGGAAMTVIAPATVGQTSMPVTKAAHPDGGGQVMTAGFIERAPLIGVLLQTPPEVALVRLIVAAVGFDEMKPVDGISALALELPANAVEGNVFDEGFPGPIPGNAQATVEYETATGERTSRRIDEFNAGLPIWNDQRCWNQGPMVPPDPDAPPPKPPPLPPAGPQPDDPAAARRDVENALTTLFTAPMEEGRQFFDYIDDASGLDVNIGPREGAEQRFIDLLEDSEVTMVELVFISPVESFFYYNLDSSVGGQVVNRLGRARFVDGAWKITRGTFCQELATVGGFCGV
jgi:hypothetical protein